MARSVVVEEPAASPTLCPFCQSTAVSTAAKRIDVSTYWRCGQCGEVWNAGRLAAQSNHRRRW